MVSLSPLTDPEVAQSWVKQYYAFDGLTYDANVENSIANLILSPQFGAIFEILRDSNAVGYACITYAYDNEVGGLYAVVTDLYLAEGARCKGIGSKALELLAAWATEQGCKTLDLFVMDHNVHAQGFYQARGFRVLDDRRVVTKLL